MFVSLLKIHLHPERVREHMENVRKSPRIEPKSYFTRKFLLMYNNNLLHTGKNHNIFELQIASPITATSVRKLQLIENVLLLLHLCKITSRQLRLIASLTS